MKRRTALSTLLTAFAGCASIAPSPPGNGTQSLSEEQKKLLDKFERIKTLEERGWSKYPAAVEEYNDGQFETAIDIALEGQEPLYKIMDVAGDAKQLAQTLDNDECVHILEDAVTFGENSGEVGLQIAKMASLMKREREEAAHLHFEMYKEKKEQAKVYEPPSVDDFEKKLG